MRRREFLAGSIALAAGKTALPSSTWAQSAPRINRIIDAHCHVFNAADLPIEGFTKKIMVPKSAQTSELVGEDQLSIEDQVEVMARIARRRDGPRVHGFVGFDPLRQALYDHRRS